MTAAEATAGGTRRVSSPAAPGRKPGERPSPSPRPEAPQLRVVPPVAEQPATAGAPATPKARRIDWAAAGTRSASVGRILYRDLVDAWPWRDVPPALRAIWATAGQPPIAHPLLRAGWRVWMYGIALPVTAVGYTTVWLHQHPARGIPTDLSLAATAASIWIF